MFKRLEQRAWTCPQCLRQQVRQSRRSLVTSSRTKGAAAAGAVADDYQQPISTAAPSIAHDDRTLRQIFDSPRFWKDFSSKTKYHSGGKSAGLLQNRYLSKPEGFGEFANVTLQKCQKIVAQVLKYNTVDQYKRITRDLDRLSDLLCRVIDLSDFIRSVHPDRQIQAAATQAYAAMFQYMNVLNTTPGLNEQLKKAASIPEVHASWSVEEKTVAEILIRDFSKSAIDLPEKEREAFVALSDEIAEVGNAFVDSMAPEKPYLQFSSSKMKGMDPVFVKQLTKWGNVTLPTEGMPAQVALRTVEDADVRQEVYMANRTSSKDNLQRLERMLRLRAELAKLSHYESFAHMTLTDKMAKSPEAVTSFLDGLAQVNSPHAREELRELLELKKGDAHSLNRPEQLNAWDRDYYTTQLMSSMRSKARTPDVLSAYFSLGTVFQGLSRLFHRLYGIRLVPHETLPGETWNSDVRRLDVIDDHEGHIAVIYCDLFERPGKSPNPAHFTLRCSRRISSEEMHEAAEISSHSSSPFSTAQEAVNDGLATNFNSRDNNALYQLPTIALICDFSLPPQGSKRPTLLTFRELTTLFHEMGHAVHSICGRTALQNVSGTRCATDFAELPSVLMENFASAPEVLGLYARHWETDTPLDPSRVQERVEIDKRMQGAETESQILLAMLDQEYHSSQSLSWQDAGESTKVYQNVWNKYSSVPEPQGTSWQGFFGHLFGYGATYYSYLFDRAIAGKIWRDVFQRQQGDAVNPAQGALFRGEVLRWGGGRDGWRCVAGVLQEKDGVLAEGGKGAMEMVGKWDGVVYGFANQKIVVQQLFFPTCHVEANWCSAPDHCECCLGLDQQQAKTYHLSRPTQFKQRYISILFIPFLLHLTSTAAQPPLPPLSNTLAPLYGMGVLDKYPDECVISLHDGQTLEKHFRTLAIDQHAFAALREFTWGYEATMSASLRDKLIRRDPGVLAVETSRPAYAIEAVDVVVCEPEGGPPWWNR
ncbi:Mitochondrial intermediate peptidase [Fulvia fulva]|uniref:Mitochondrial intermediate peptidase n=1 Tax=Passalora fulva TaxID=5499 RepID=A0A9Q8PJW7_PASFU|nr:Mitochondrial intermediate peptidase [Fulvia fulva]KAK4611648.1 Mitochondrial intermediate peptidase [Fulvia fulva]UJO23734.1 Mitochondrial intermediate peptidase [Fulvia fulva]WPV21544.1 Mitochondrial intermediate peptidase [Fulvia fulva]WPV36312.1 Mitochondrial intermediate peptidase [Fulvia fulva]